MKPLWLYVEGLVQNRLGHAAFGLYSALFALCFICTAFADLGLNQFAAKEIARQRNFFEQHFPVLFSLKLGILAVFPALLMVIGLLLGYDTNVLWLLFWIAAGVSLLQLLQFFRSVLQAHQLFNTDSFLAVADKLLAILLIAVSFNFAFTLQRYIYLRFGAVLLTVVLAYVILFLKTKPPKPAFKHKKAISLLRSSLPFALMTLVYGLNEKIDMVLLERMHSGTEAGLYAAAYRWVDAVMMYLWTVLPIFFARFAAVSGNNNEQSGLLRFGQVLVAVPIIFVSLGVFFYGEHLFWFLTASTAGQLHTMQVSLKVLFASVLVHGLAAIYSTLLTATGYEKQISWLVAAGIIINIVLNVVFIPIYGALAAAYNTLVSAVCMSVGYLVFMARFTTVKPSYMILTKLIVLSLLGAAFHFLLLYLNVKWVLAVLLSGCMLVVLTFVLRLITLKQLFSDSISS